MLPQLLLLLLSPQQQGVRAAAWCPGDSCCLCCQPVTGGAGARL
jgi:hypothetical protein